MRSSRSTSHRIALAAAASLAVIACADAPQPARSGVPASVGAETPSATEDFWSSLQALCGRAFSGRVVESQPPDPAFEGQPLVMHVRECGDEEIRIPFFVGDDRSRTWVITPTTSGLRLKHDHRHEDGTEDEVTQYGGDTRDAGTSGLQEFFADAFTAQLVPAAATNVWSIEIDPGLTFAYDLRREGSDRRFRAEFDLRNPIEPPPPPWGG